MEFLKETELSDNQKNEVSLVFAGSFFRWFSYFQKKLNVRPEDLRIFLVGKGFILP